MVNYKKIISYRSLFICFLVFNRLTSFAVQAQANSAVNTDNIIITNNSSVIKDLTEMGAVEITKSSFLGTKVALTKKAELDLKQQAVVKGGNIIFITKNDYITDPNSYITKMHMVGVVYKNDSNPNKLAVTSPNLSSSTSSDSSKTLLPGLNLSITDCIGDPVAQTVTLYFTFTNSTNIDRNISVFGGPHTTGVMANYIQKSSAFDDSGNQYECKDDFYFISGKELPADLRLKGMIVFSNILPATQVIALAKLSVQLSDWNGGSNMQRYIINFKNLTINWNGNATFNKNQPTVNWDTQIKNLGNDIDFTVIGCKGDPKMQTVTLFFTFSNPRKSNQKIVVQNGFMDNRSTAFNVDGTQYPFKSLSLGGESNSNQLDKELLTGLTLKGSITFSNVLPSVKGFAMAKIPTVTSNWDGGDNMVMGMIEVKNVAIDWTIHRLPTKQ